MNPDARPWLSQREADEAIANLDVRRLCFDGRSLTLTEFLAETAKCPSYYAAVRTASSPLHARHADPSLLSLRLHQPHIRDFTAGHHHPFSSLMSQSALADIRSMEIRRKCPVRDLNDILHEVDVFQALEAFCLGFLPCVPLGTKWYGGVQHRIVVLFSLLQQRKQGNVEVPFAYCRNAYELVEKYIAAEMDAKAADALISALRLLIDRQTMALKWLLPISCAS